jgi:hypothetical protein
MGRSVPAKADGEEMLVADKRSDYFLKSLRVDGALLSDPIPLEPTTDEMPIL